MDPSFDHVTDWQAYVFARVAISGVAQRHRLMVRTRAGGAHAVEHALELFPRALVLGAIAGDDSVLAICPSAEAANRLADFLASMREGGEAAEATKHPGSEARNLPVRAGAGVCA